MYGIIHQAINNAVLSGFHKIPVVGLNFTKNIVLFGAYIQVFCILHVPLPFLSYQ